MNRALLIAPLSVLVATLALSAAPTAFAGEVYQWKDANGVTHYSQTPPKQGKFAARSIYHRELAVEGQIAEAAPTESRQCVTARGNIELLQSGAKLQLDSDGDGKADKDLDDSARAEQLRIAQTVARVNCSPSTAKAP